MTAVFDWSGAPEGERWVMLMDGPARNRYVIVCDEETGRETAMVWSGKWVRSLLTPAVVRQDGTRVESARPAPRVGDRVRVSVEGTMLDALKVGQIVNGAVVLGLGTALQPDYTVEVLQRADPPLQPGDLVRDDRGVLFMYRPDTNRSKSEGWNYRVVIGADGNQPMEGMRGLSRDEIDGPLVKVQLTEVPDA